MVRMDPDRPGAPALRPVRCAICGYAVVMTLARRRQTYWMTPKIPTARPCASTNAMPSAVGATQPLTNNSELAAVHARLTATIVFTAPTDTVGRDAMKATTITYGIRTNPTSRISANGRPSQLSRKPAPATSDAALAPLAAASASKANRSGWDIGTALVMTTLLCLNDAEKIALRHPRSDYRKGNGIDHRMDHLRAGHGNS